MATNTIPRSLMAAGFLPPDMARRTPGSPFKRLTIATEGRADSGKTEWALSCPGPGAVICIDKGFDAVFDNQTPPPTRNTNFGFKLIQASKPTQEPLAEYLRQWTEFRTEVYNTMALPEVRTIVLDTDSDSWQLQRLAEHGKLVGIYPATKFTDVKAARRGFYDRLWKSGKIIVGTNRLVEEWKDQMGPDGLPILDKMTGEPKRIPVGTYRADGFPEHEYMWQLRIRHLFKPAEFLPKFNRMRPKKWGIQIIKCKPNVDLIGTELWGDDCNFAGLVGLVYPHIDPKEWGL